MTAVDWKDYQVQIAVRKKDMSEVVKLLAKAIEFEIDEKGYFKFIKKLRKGTRLETT